MTSLLTLSRARYPEVKTHSIFTSLIDDMVTTVFDHLHVESLLRLRATGAVADAYVSDYLHRRLVGHLRRYVDNPFHFLDELETCCSVISGSSALAILFRHFWIPGDLDVYTPRPYFWHVVAYLVHVEGYTAEFLADPDYTMYGNVRSVARLSRPDGRRIDVVQSVSNSALLPIASFWNTAVICYITHNHFCAPYASLTDELQALATMSPSPDSEDGASGARFPMVDIDLVRKYEHRGFTVRADSLSWPRTCDPSAACAGMGTAYCPLTMRYFGDRYCVTGVIESVRERRAPRPLKNLVQDYTVIWWRGGQTCGGECAAAGNWVYPSSYSCVRTLLPGDEV